MADMSIVCTKDFTITVNSASGRFYWTFDEPNPGDSHLDKFSSLPLYPFVGSGWIDPVIDPSGKYGNAIRAFLPATQFYLTNDAVLFGNTPLLKYTQGTGFTFWCWLKPNNIGDYTQGTSSIILSFLTLYDLVGNPIWQLDCNLINNEVFAAFEDYVNPTTETVQVFPMNDTPGTWQLLLVKCDPGNGNKVSIRLNMGAWVNGVKVFNLSSAPVGNITFFTSISGSPVAWDWTVDEMGLYYKVLTEPEIATLYNGGAGITWPAVQSLA